MPPQRDTQLTCSECKGTFFYKAQAEQFNPGGFGSAEFRSTSNAPKLVLVCIGCGVPVIPRPSYYAKGTTAGIAETEFTRSVEVGKKYRSANTISNIATIAASPSEVEELRAQIDELRKVILSFAKPPILNPETEQPVQKKAKGRKEAKDAGA